MSFKVYEDARNNKQGTPRGFKGCKNREGTAKVNVHFNSSP